MTAFLTPKTLGSLFARTDLDTALPGANPGSGRPWIGSDGLMRVGAAVAGVPTLPPGAQANQLAAFDGAGGFQVSNRVDVVTGASDYVSITPDVGENGRASFYDASGYGSLNLGSVADFDRFQIANNSGWAIGTTASESVRIRVDNTDRMLFHTNGNIGINQTNPQSSLDIVGSFRASGEAIFNTGRIRIGGWASNASYYGMHHQLADPTAYMIMSQGTDTFVGAHDNSKIYLRPDANASTYQITLHPNRWPTIGAGETNQIWHAGNDGAASGLDADLLDGQQGAYYLDLANHTGSVNVASGGTGLSAIPQDRIPFGNGTSPVGTSAGLTYATGTEALTVGGSVFFGGGGGNAQGELYSTSTRVGLRSSNLMGISMDDANQRIFFATNNTEQMRIWVDGLITMGGSATNIRRLQMRGYQQIQTLTNAVPHVIYESPMALSSGTTIWQDYKMASSTTVARTRVNYSGADASSLQYEVFVDGLVTPALVARSGGLVGVNTSLPTNPLHVVQTTSTGAVSSSPAVVVENASTPTIHLKGSSGNVGAIRFGDDAAWNPAGISYNHANGGLIQDAETSQQFSIGGNGIISITSGQAVLLKQTLIRPAGTAARQTLITNASAGNILCYPNDVSATARNGVAFADHVNGTVHGGFLAYMSSGALSYFYIGDFGSELLVARPSTGNVGIGAGLTNPSSKLHVAGDLRVTGPILDSAGAAGTAGQILSSTVTGTAWIAAPSGGGGSSSLTEKYVGYGSGANELTGSAALQFDPATSQLKVGTSSASSEKLHVTGSATTNLVRFENTSTSYDRVGVRFKAVTSGGAAAHADIGVQATGTDTGNFYIRMPWSNATPSLAVSHQSYLGVRTATPTAALHVVGSDQFNTMRIETPTATKFEFQNASGEPSIKLSAANGDNWSITRAYANRLAFTSSTGNEWISVVGADGRVGLNKTDPSRMLHLRGNVTNGIEPIIRLETGNPNRYAAVEFDDAGTLRSDISYANGSTADFEIRHWNSSLSALSRRFTAHTSGRIGINGVNDGTLATTRLTANASQYALELSGGAFRDSQHSGNSYYFVGGGANMFGATTHFESEVKFTMSDQPITQRIYSLRNEASRFRLDTSVNGATDKQDLFSIDGATGFMTLNGTGATDLLHLKAGRLKLDQFYGVRFSNANNTIYGSDAGGLFINTGTSGGSSVTRVRIDTAGRVAVGGEPDGSSANFQVVGQSNWWSAEFNRGIRDDLTSANNYYSANGNNHQFGRPVFCESMLCFVDGTLPNTQDYIRVRHTAGDVAFQKVSSGVTLNADLMRFDLPLERIGINEGIPTEVLDVGGSITGQVKEIDAAPTTADIKDGYFKVVKDTETGEVQFAVNDGGTIKTLHFGVQPENTVAPAITGDVYVYEEVAIDNGEWTATSGLQYDYRWRADGTLIDDATGQTYTPQIDDAGKELDAIVTAYTRRSEADATTATRTVRAWALDRVHQQYMFSTAPSLSGNIADEQPNLGTDRPRLPGRAIDTTGAAINLGTLNLTSSFTISMHVKPSTTAGTVGYLSGATTTVGDGIAIAHAGGTYRLFGAVNRDTGVAVVPGKWVHLAVTFDQADSNQLRFYLDGLLVYEVSDALVNFNTQHYVNRLYAGAAGNRANAVMSDLQIIQHKLTQSQVEELYKLREFALPDVVRYRHFKCDEQHPDRLYDSSHFQAHGVPQDHTPAVGSYYYQGDDVPVDYLNRVGHGEDEYRPEGSIVPGDWEDAANFDITTDSIVSNPGAGTIRLLDMKFDKSREYHIEFDVPAEDANFGPRVGWTRSDGGGGFWAVPTAVPQADHTGTGTSSYITNTGHYHCIVSVSSSVTSDTASFVFNRVNGHTGSMTITNLKVYAADDFKPPRNEGLKTCSVNDSKPVLRFPEWGIDANVYKDVDGSYKEVMDEYRYRPTITKVRYVSPTGSNGANGLTPGTAWQTLSHAITQAGANTRYILAPGTYQNAASWPLQFEVICEDGQATFTTLQMTFVANVVAYMKGVRFNELVNSPNGGIRFFDQCHFARIANDATAFDDGVVITRDCTCEEGIDGDVLDYSTATDALEIRNVMANIGTDASDNISTAHDSSAVVRVGCNYSGAPRVVHDVNSSRSTLIDCNVHTSTSLSSNPEDSACALVGFPTTGGETAQMRVYGGTYGGGAVSGLFVDSDCFLAVADDVTLNSPISGTFAATTARPAKAITYSGQAPRDAQAVESNCATFAGAQEVISPAVPITAGMTVSFWIKCNFTLDASSKGIVCSTTDANNNFRIIHTNSGIWTGWTIGGVTYTGVSDDLPPNDTWVHVIVESDGVGRQKIYFDGVEQTTADNSPGYHTTGGELVIGNRTNNFLQAEICDVRIYNRVLTDEERTGELGVNGLIAWYPMAEGDGDVHWDVVRNIHSTITGHTPADYFANKQNKFHYNLKYGRRYVENYFRNSAFAGALHQTSSSGVTHETSPPSLATYGSHCIAFADQEAGTKFGYVLGTPNLNGERVYATVYALREDGEQPVALSDFRFVIGSSAPSSVDDLTYEHVGNNVYKISCSFVAAGTGTNAGVIQYAARPAIRFTGLSYRLDPEALYIQTAVGEGFPAHHLPAKPDGTWVDAGTTPADHLPAVVSGVMHNLAETKIDTNPTESPYRDYSLPTNVADISTTNAVYQPSIVTGPADNFSYTNLLTNGTFDSDISGWTDASIGTGSIAWDAGRMLLTAAASTNRAYPQQAISTVPGRTYTVSFSATNIGFLRVGASDDVNNAASYDVLNQASVAGANNFTFVAETTTTYITFNTGTLSGTMHLDNFVVFEGLGPQREIVLNGRFSRGTEHWTSARGAVLSVEGGRLKVAYSNNPAFSAYQTINTVSGRKYRVTAETELAVGIHAIVSVRTENTAVGGTALGFANGPGPVSFEFTGNGATVFLHLVAGNDPGTYSFFDNVSILELPRLRLAETAIAGAHGLVLNQDLVVGNKYTIVFDAKAAERTAVQINLSGTHFNEADTRVDLTDGSVDAGSAVVQELVDGWYRIRMQVTCKLSATDALAAYILLYNAAASYAGDGYSAIYVDNVMFAPLHYDTSMPLNGYEPPRLWHPIDNPGNVMTRFRRRLLDGKLSAVDRLLNYNSPLVGQDRVDSDRYLTDEAIAQ